MDDTITTPPHRLAAVLVVIGLLTMILTPVSHARPSFGIDAGVEESLGHPIPHLNSSSNGLTTTADGRPLALLVANSDHAVFSAVDANTGELVFQQVMTDVGGVLGMATGKDGRVYLATSYRGQVWRYDPDAGVLEPISPEYLYGQTNLRKMAVADDGTILIGTYPDGKVISYDPDTEVFTDLGGFGADLTYVQSIAVEGRKVYVGTAPRVTVFELDLDSGQRTEIPLPDEIAEDKNVWGIEAYDGQVFAMTSPTRLLHVHDIGQTGWRELDTRVAFHSMPSPRTVTGPDGLTRREIHYVGMGTRSLRGQDLNTGEIRDLLPIDGDSTSSIDWEWVNLGIGGDYPDLTLVGADGIAGKIYQWNPQTGASRVVDGDFAPAHAKIRSINEGPDGNIYLSGYASATGLIQFDTATDEFTALKGPAQIEQIGFNGSRLVLGLYGGAQVYDYDTAAEWDFGVNPRSSIKLGDEQDRVTSVVAIDDNITALSSFPFQGRVGGALSFYDHTTRKAEVHRNVIQDQTPLELVYRDGLIYGGTGISVGLGTEPTTTQGHLFIYDVAARELVFATVPVPGESHVVGLDFDADGILWGLTGNTVFTFDPQSRTVTHVERYSQRDDSGTYVVGRDLIVLADRIVGHTGGEVFVIDPRTWQRSVIARKDSSGGAVGLGVDDEGRWYYSFGTELFRWTPCGSDVRDNQRCAELQRSR